LLILFPPACNIGESSSSVTMSATPRKNFNEASVFSAQIKFIHSVPSRCFTLMMGLFPVFHCFLHPADDGTLNDVSLLNPPDDGTSPHVSILSHADDGTSHVLAKMFAVLNAADDWSSPGVSL
ncbi:hypothetical protein L9F63_026249, partial [Diploptera punctata]